MTGTPCSVSRQTWSICGRQVEKRYPRGRLDRSHTRERPLHPGTTATPENDYHTRELLLQSTFVQRPQRRDVLQCHLLQHGQAPADGGIEQPPAPGSEFLRSPLISVLPGPQLAPGADQLAGFRCP